METKTMEAEDVIENNQSFVLMIDEPVILVN